MFAQRTAVVFSTAPTPKALTTSPSSPPDTPVQSAERLYYDVAMMRLTAQLAQVDTIDSKASSMFTIASTILPITAGLLTGDREVVANSIVAKLALAAGAVAYLVLVGAFTWSYRLVQWDARPELSQWKGITVGRLSNEMERWLGDACTESYEANRPQLDKKSRLVGVGLWLLAVEATSLTIAVLVPLF